MILPRDLVAKRKEYYVYGLFLSMERKGMTGPILPSTSPKLKAPKVYMARYVFASIWWLFIVVFYLNKLIICFFKRSFRQG